MTIPPQKIELKLYEDTPSEVTPADLKVQLNRIGLTCSDADEDKLEEYIKDVREKLPNGRVETFVIGTPAKNSRGVSTLELKPIAHGNWYPDDSFGYHTYLMYIQHEPNFDYLLENKVGFTGVKESPPIYEDTDTSADVIKEQFLKITWAASATLVNGLNKRATEAILYDAIADVPDNATDYAPGWDSRVLFLVDDYDPVLGLANGLGVLTITWNLFIKEYKEKKKTSKKWTLEVRAWSVLYSSLSAMYDDYYFIDANFKAYKYMKDGGIPPEDRKVEIFEEFPPPTEDTFTKGLPVIAKTGYARVIVLYAPDLQQLGSIDNSKSKASSSWSKTVTTGFTFSTTQEISMSYSFEANAIVVKSGYSFSLAVSFTSQWNTSTSETISFEVPAGEMAFTYQGTIYARILDYIPGEGKFVYDEAAKFLSSVIATTNTPLIQK